MNLDQYTISFIFSGNDLETTNIYIYIYASRTGCKY